MNDAYKQIRNFNKRLESFIGSNKDKKESSKGLLSRRNPSTTKQEFGESNFNKRIANYVSTIRQRRMGLKDV